MAFTTLNSLLLVFFNEYEHVTNNLACVLRTFQNILQIVWSHFHTRHSCGSSFTCFEAQEQHIIPKVNTFYAKTLLVIVTNTEAEKLLDNCITKPAFEFVN